MVNDCMQIGAVHSYCIVAREFKLLVFQADCKLEYLISK